MIKLEMIQIAEKKKKNPKRELDGTTSSNKL